MKEPKQIRRGGQIHYDGPDREWLMYQYHTLDKSTVDIQKEFGVSRTAQKYWMHKFKVPVKSRDYIHAVHSKRMSGNGNPAWNGGTARNYQVRALKKIRPKVCEWCGATENVQIHHIDHNRDNCDLANLMWLCGYCNRLEAQIWCLEKLGRASHDLSDNQLVINFKTDDCTSLRGAGSRPPQKDTR